MAIPLLISRSSSPHDSITESPCKHGSPIFKRQVIERNSIVSILLSFISTLPFFKKSYLFNLAALALHWLFALHWLSIVAVSSGYNCGVWAYYSGFSLL